MWVAALGPLSLLTERLNSLMDFNFRATPSQKSRICRRILGDDIALAWELVGEREQIDVEFQVGLPSIPTKGRLIVLLASRRSGM